MPAVPTTKTGILERHFEWYFVRNEDGRRWRIEGDQRRFEHLIGMLVEVTGPLLQGAIVVQGIHPA